jgi:RNase H-fold protein (predicted Holliday junction resolvase)
MEDNLIMQSAKDFAEKIQELSGAEAVFHPEFLSSVQARHLQDKGAKIDASAAAIILQSYLDIQQNANRK